MSELKNQITRIQASLTIFRDAGSNECCKECTKSRTVAQEILSNFETGAPLPEVVSTLVIEAAEPPRLEESIVVAELLKERDDLEIELLERYTELREVREHIEKRDKEIERLKGGRWNNGHLGVKKK